MTDIQRQARELRQRLEEAERAHPGIFSTQGFDPCLDYLPLEWFDSHARLYGANAIGLLALWLSAAQTRPIREEHMYRGMFYGSLIATMHLRRPETVLNSMIASSYGIRIREVFQFFLLEIGAFDDMCYIAAGSEAKLREFRRQVEEVMLQWETYQGL